jgi:PTH1 family peptidyl-tRNA hydrolase
MENLYLIVGLGNPGADYVRTRHNAGFLLAERLAGRWQAGWSQEKKFQARLSKTERDGQKLILCQPQTFMNGSGEAVRAVSEFFHAPVARLLVLVDDADLPFGEIRMRPGGNSGGHHGLESIEQHLGSQQFARLRIGIGRRSDGVREIVGHVLGPFGSADTELLDKVLERAADQVECWLQSGTQRAMNQFNGAVSRSENKEPK